jgi:hypothetical protein
MRHKHILVLVIALLLTAGFLLSPGSAQAQSARTAQWVVSITYQNIGDSATLVNVQFYPEGSSTAVSYNPLGSNQLQANAGASFFIGNVQGLASGFRGNAVMGSSSPLGATAVQFSQQSGFKMRLLSNGFSTSQISDQYLVATTLLNRFSRTTVFSIQNTTSNSIDATVRFYDSSNGALAAQKTHTILANSSKYIEMDDVNDTGLPAATTTFDGSAIVTAVRTGSSDPAQVVASANELYTNRPVALAFEGLPLSNAANNVYMATALCQRFGLDTFYAVQNASLSDPATITVRYRNTDGSDKATDGPYQIGPGQKRAITTCSPSSGVSMSGFTGSAVIESSGAPIVAIGKAQNSINAGTPATQDVFTGFLGERQGASELALPFVRWASDANFTAASNVGGKQRAFIAIQNLGASTAKVVAEYYDKNGVKVGEQTLTIPGFSKGNTDANNASALGKNGMNQGEFGYYTDGSFGGSVTVKAHADNPGAKFIAIARVQHPGAGEDYNAIPVQ